MSLSKKEVEVFEFIKKRLEDGFAPTVREICKEFGYKSTSTAHRRIQVLTDNGLLEKGSNQNRAIRLAGRGATRVPLVGTVTAGQPITAIEDVTDYISFYPQKNYDDELFALKIRGDSMINAGILNSDIVVVEKTEYAENGDIVVALVDEEEATVKRFFKENGKYRLQPENDTMEPIIVDEVSIVGKVVAVMRYL